MRGRLETLLMALTGLAVALISAGCATGPKEPRLTPQQRELNVESFDCVWAKIRDEYWDPQLGGLDWQAVRDELRPRVEQAAIMSEARGIMRDMIGRLGLSHFGIFPAELMEGSDQPGAEGASTGVTGIDLRVIDGQALVTSVADGSPAAEAGVRPGWEVVRIGNVDIAPKLRQLALELEDTPNKPLALAYAVIPRLSGRIGDSVAVRFRDGDDGIIGLEIPLAAPRGHKIRFGHINDIVVWIDVDLLEGNVGYIAFNGFFGPQYVMKAYNDGMQAFAQADGIVIDLRGNGGGLGGMAMGMLGWLVAETRHLGTMYLRDNEIKLLVQPRPNPYAGPVAVLVDGLSGSASEFFAGGLQEIGRARIVGSRTKGEALPGRIEKLPNGDVFLYATANYVTAGGRMVEGVGVTPDIEVLPTREALLAGRDLVLEAAVAWIKDQQ